MSTLVTIVAILRAEDQFIDEWIAYHRLIGVDRFVLYDDDPRQTLKRIVAKFNSFITVFDWADDYHIRPGRNRQTKAYEHSLSYVLSDWIAFIDVDEFIVLRKHSTLSEFLDSFTDAEAVVLTWHMFGHNGYFDNPPGLITEALFKRQQRPGKMVKSIVRRNCVTRVMSGHRCSVLHNDAVFDANHRAFTTIPYPGKTSVANINHYFCRSFTNWMMRVERGEVAYTTNSYPIRDKWRFDDIECLRRFVDISARYNEIVDLHMLAFSELIRDYLSFVNQTEQ